MCGGGGGGRGEGNEGIKTIKTYVLMLELEIIF